MPQNIYDDPNFFQGYSQLRRSREGLTGAPEWQVLQEMLPSVQGMRVLDLGCGFGAFSRWAREQGAQRVVGVDLSEKMLNEARARTGDTGVAYYQAEMENPGLAEASFDLIYSALALHYIQDFGALCAALTRILTPHGHFVFSIEHPIYTAPSHPGWQTNADGTKIWALDSYLREGERVTDWIAPGVVKYHRTIGTYLNTLREHGFQLVRLEEWGPSPEQIAANPEWADEVQRPPFLLVAAQLET